MTLPLRTITAALKRHWVRAGSFLRRRRTCIGLALGATSVRIVGVRRGRVEWAIEGDVAAGEPLEEAIAGLLGSAPRSRVFSARVVACIGPTQAQVKRVAGLPQLDDPQALRLLLQENLDRLFLSHGVPLVASDTWRDCAGDPRAAAFEEPMVDAILTACRSGHTSLEAVVPSIAVIGAGVRDEHVEWRDGDVIATLSFQGGVLAHSSRRPGRWEKDGPATSLPDGATRAALTAVPALEVLGERAAHFADAFGAATYPGELPMALRPGRASRHASTSRLRIRMAAICLVSSILAAMVAPGIQDAITARRVAQRLAVLSDARAEVARLESELQQVTAALAEVDGFARRGLPALPFLAALTEAYPAGTAISAMRMDSAGATIAIVGPSALTTLVATGRVPGVKDAQLVGPISRERYGDRELERATIRVHFARTLAAESSGTRDSVPEQRGVE